MKEVENEVGNNNGSNTPVEMSSELITDIRNKLNDDDIKEAQSYSNSIVILEQNSIFDYGNDVQDKLSTFSGEVLSKVQNKDLGEIGDSLRDLVGNLNEANPEKLSAEKKSPFLKIFKNVRRSIYEMTAKYQEVSVQIDRTALQLKVQENNLLKNNITLEDMYKVNFEYYSSLNILIVGAEIKLNELEKDINYQAENLLENDQMANQQVQDLLDAKNHLSKKINDLMITRQLTIQQAPQIRLIQNSNTVLAEKIRTSINTAIPLWKNQVTIALTLLKQENAVATQTAVSDTTNDLLRKNSSMLKQSTIDTTKAGERGLIDIETLRETQSNLIGTIQETLKIQEDGNVKRKEVESELRTMEIELKNNLVNNVKGRKDVSGDYR